MYGLTTTAMWWVLIVAGATLLAWAFFSIMGEDAMTYAYNVWRAVWYDLVYFFFGPRMVEV